LSTQNLRRLEGVKLKVRSALVSAIAVMAPLLVATPAHAHDAISFDAQAFTVTEGGRASIVVRRCCHESTPTSVRVTTSPGTAEPGSDYTHVDRVLSFTSAQEPAEIEIPITNDEIAEEPRTVNLILSEPGAGSILGYPRTAVLTIIDDDGPARVSFAPGTFEKFENRGTLELQVVRSGDRSSVVSVAYATEDGESEAGYAKATTGSDYQAASGTLTFAANSGIRVQRIAVRLIDDKLTEGDESFFVRLSSPSGAELVEPSVAEAVILDDESGVGDTTPPISAFHYPLDGKTYRRDRFRDLLVFNQDNDGGAGVRNVQVAILKRFRSGRCAWWTGSGFKKGACTKKQWVRKPASYELVVFKLGTTLEKSTGSSRVRRYVAFSRAVDAVGNKQQRFRLGQNRVRFDIK
jgi:hypothetical protein